MKYNYSWKSPVKKALGHCDPANVTATYHDWYGSYTDNMVYLSPNYLS